MRHTRLCLLVVIVVTGCGCAGERPHTRTTPSAPASLAVEEVTSAESIAREDALAISTLGAREVSSRGRSHTANAQVAEQWSAELAAAIARRSTAPTVENEIALAQTLAALGIADQAHGHFAAAARLSPHESAAWDGMARIWRDWGLPQFGLGDAYRAVAADPQSPAVRNTLGTILEFLGYGRDARMQFARALALDPGAAYAQNNICYSWVLEGCADVAAEACRQALAMDPNLSVARNNLGLARAIDGDFENAAAVFAEVGGTSASQYNLGMVYLALGRYSAAANAFDRASESQPALKLARVRAAQARERAMDTPDGGRDNHERR